MGTAVHSIPGLVPKNGKLYYQFQIHGETFSGTLDLDDTPDNRILAGNTLSEMRRDIKRGDVVPSKFSAFRRFDHAADEFNEWLPTRYNKPSTVRSYRAGMVSLVEFFNKTAIHCIHEPEVERYKFWRKTEHEVADVTLRHNLHVLSVFFQWAKKFGYLKINPIRAEDIAIPSDKDSLHERVITFDEEQRYTELAAKLKNKNLLHVTRLMLDQGMRPSEVFTLEVVGLSEENQTVKIFVGKSRSAKRTLFLTAECFRLLKTRLEVAKALGTRWLFPSTRRPNRPINSVSNDHAAVLKRMKVSFRLYDFRHTFATRAGENGMDLPTLAYVLGHGDLSTLRRYVHPGQSHASAAMKEHERLEQEAWQRYIEGQKRVSEWKP
jgi:integrase